MSKDLTVEAFLALNDVFFDQKGLPKLFALPPKANTQDDPLDSYIVKELSSRLGSEGIKVLGSGSPLISPDLALRDAGLSKVPSDPTDLSKIVGVEVKKLERTNGRIARESGLDYNSTPPCGTIRVYTEDRDAIDVRGFYLFVCQESDQPGKNFLSALALTDGNFLNEDFGYYLAVTGVRTKETDLGTFKDGANRLRPMVIFSNPLSVKQLDEHATLIHPDEDLHHRFPGLRVVGTITRTIPDSDPKQVRTYYCYRVLPSEPDARWNLTDPLKKPKRQKATQQRGRFTIDLESK